MISTRRSTRVLPKNAPISYSSSRLRCRELQVDLLEMVARRCGTIRIQVDAEEILRRIDGQLLRRVLVDLVVTRNGRITQRAT